MNIFIHTFSRNFFGIHTFGDVDRMASSGGDTGDVSVHLVELLEADVLGVLPEALAAHVQPVLADHTVAVGAGTAGKKI